MKQIGGGALSGCIWGQIQVGKVGEGLRFRLKNFTHERIFSQQATEKNESVIRTLYYDETLNLWC
jgi:hypothetical protein